MHYFLLPVFIPHNLYSRLPVQNDCCSGDGSLAISDERLGDVGDSFIFDQIFFGKDCLFGQVQQVQSTHFVTRHHLVVGVGLCTQAGQDVEVQAVLREVLRD